MKKQYKQGYIQYTNNGKTEHREIMKPILLDALEELFPTIKWDVHHRDGDRSNNNIFNLEVMDKSKHTSISNLNRRGKCLNKYKYCHYVRKNNQEKKCWQVQIRYHDRNKSLGIFEDPITASLVGTMVVEEIKDV